MKIIKSISILLILTLTVSLCATRVAALEVADITAPTAVLMDAGTGKSLFEKDPHAVRACASITKVMTLILIMEAIDKGQISMEDKISTSAHASSMGGSDIWLASGEVMSVDELIKATVVASANDAAVALAEYVCGSEESFVTCMNQKAYELGMSDTTFKNCNGLDEEGHLTSAYDVAVMSRELIKHEKIFNYSTIWMDYLRDGETQLVNTNKLLKSYPGITGLKTGTTSQAGSCISATASRDNLNLIAVVLGCENGKDRFKNAAKILDYGFANFTLFTPKVETSGSVKIVNGMNHQVNTKVNIDNGFLIPKGKEKQVTNHTELPDEIEAPVENGQVIGKVLYNLDEEVVAQYNIVTENCVKKIDFSSIFNTLLNNMVAM